MLPFFKFGHESVCAYCGEYADTTEHCIAVSYQGTNDNSRTTGFGPITYACNDCNSSLTNRYFDTFKLKCEWANERLKRKCKAILWSKQELETLDHSLKTHIERQQARSLLTQLRADYYLSRDFCLNLEGLCFEVAQLLPTSDENRFIKSYFSESVKDIQNCLNKR